MASREEVEQANIELSKQLADKYNETEPHYKPENKGVVRDKLSQLKEQTQGKELLDMGCGTGFIIDIAKEFFEDINGVDISQEMLDKVNIEHKRGRVRLFKESTEASGFSFDYFDIVTAYSLLHHLHNIEPTIKEAYRVLKPGGIFWSALDPNYYFREALHSTYPNPNYSEIVRREITKMVNEESNSLYQKAEPLKQLLEGFNEEFLRGVFKRVGFSFVDIEYYWFLGEGAYELGERGRISNYLKEVLPLSRHLFKYLSITARK